MPIKTRRDYEVELMAEKIPGCQGVYEDIGPHLVHMTKWLIDSLIDARIKIDELTRAPFPVRAPEPVREKLIEAASRELVAAMETCHICRGTVIVESDPVHCEDCSFDCDRHNEPECTPIYELHRKLIAALALAEESK